MFLVINSRQSDWNTVLQPTLDKVEISWWPTNSHIKANRQHYSVAITTKPPNLSSTGYNQKITFLNQKFN